MLTIRFLTFFLIFAPIFVLAEPPAETLTIYVYPPSRDLNWNSPKKLLTSFIKTGVEKLATKNYDVTFVSDFGEPGNLSSNYISTMGHTIGHVQCTLPDGKVYDKWASFSGQDYSEADDKVTKELKLGMGALYYPFVDGHIIAGQENVKRLVHFNGPTPRFIDFALDRASCLRLAEMIQFFEGFHYKHGTSLATLEARGPEGSLFFSSIHDPYSTYLNRKKTGRGEVGGGCAPFGAALIKVIGQYPVVFESYFRRPLEISEKLIGGTTDPSTNQVRMIELTDLLMPYGGIGESWTHPNTVTRNLSLYDPQKIYEFIGTLKNCADNKSCPPDLSNWIKKSRSRISGAPVRTFQDSYKVTVRTPKTNQARVHTRTASVTIPGISIR